MTFDDIDEALRGLGTSESGGGLGVVRTYCSLRARAWLLEAFRDAYIYSTKSCPVLPKTLALPADTGLIDVLVGFG